MQRLSVTGRKPGVATVYEYHNVPADEVALVVHDYVRTVSGVALSVPNLRSVVEHPEFTRYEWVAPTGHVVTVAVESEVSEWAA